MRLRLVILGLPLVEIDVQDAHFHPRPTEHSRYQWQHLTSLLCTLYTWPFRSLVGRCSDLNSSFSEILYLLNINLNTCKTKIIQPSVPQVAGWAHELCKGTSRSLWPTVRWTWAPPHEVQSATWDWQETMGHGSMNIRPSYLSVAIRSPSFIYISKRVSIYVSIGRSFESWLLDTSSCRVPTETASRWESEAKRAQSIMKWSSI